MSKTGLVTIIMITVLMGAAAASGCAATQQRYPDQYLQSLQEIPAATPDPGLVQQRFLAVYQNLGGEDLQQRVAAAYAEEFYFNDTLETHRQHSDLLEYLRLTGEKTTSMEVEILAVIPHGNDIFLQWRMDIQFKALGRVRSTRSVGISHLRVNQQQKIILHQDYWDGAEGIYRQIPVLGRLIPGE